MSSIFLDKSFDFANKLLSFCFARVFFSDSSFSFSCIKDLFLVSNSKILSRLTSVFLLFTCFLNSEKLKLVLYYLLIISVLLEVFHILIPERSFQWSDLFGNLLGVIVVIFVKSLINKYGITKK